MLFFSLLWFCFFSALALLEKCKSGTYHLAYQKQFSLFTIASFKRFGEASVERMVLRIQLLKPYTLTALAAFTALTPLEPLQPYHPYAL